MWISIFFFLLWWWLWLLFLKCFLRGFVVSERPRCSFVQPASKPKFRWGLPIFSKVRIYLICKTKILKMDNHLFLYVFEPIFIFHYFNCHFAQDSYVFVAEIKLSSLIWTIIKMWSKKGIVVTAQRPFFLFESTCYMGIRFAKW